MARMDPDDERWQEEFDAQCEREGVPGRGLPPAGHAAMLDVLEGDVPLVLSSRAVLEGVHAMPEDARRCDAWLVIEETIVHSPEQLEALSKLPRNPNVIMRTAEEEG